MTCSSELKLDGEFVIVELGRGGATGGPEFAIFLLFSASMQTQSSRCGLAGGLVLIGLLI